ncbi:shikimate dehydrogenase family protein [Microbacterium sp. B2969]|uniref:Shikimate dehydrogenase family protein n=1 Tax=Microbacterium alkaliflavum TaxID=3248839 RepID=A0ABW7QDT8_9MICO
MPTQPNGASRLFPIIGDPIRYVESPVSLTRTFAERGHNAACIPMEAPEDALDIVMQALSATTNVDGILVTKPHKFTAAAYCATVSERTRLLGAVSTIRRNPDGTWHGDTLDGLAFLKAQRDHGARIEGSKALLIGAGGAGSAIAIELVRGGVRELVIYDPDGKRALELWALVTDLGEAQVSVGPADPTGFDLVFNASPMGMADDDPMPVDGALLSSDMFVGDVIAGHGTTPFIAAAQAAGCRTANGTDMVDAVQDIMADLLLGADIG